MKKGLIMAGHELKREQGSGEPVKKRKLSAAARRALAEADMRRKQQKIENTASETGGPEGLEPTRYGDWERKGIASDF